MTPIALIPARGGSKGIPRKNLREVGGKPLIQWSIEAALESNLLQRRVYVTSDDDQILDLSRKLGALTIKRPPEISDDKASSESALDHGIQTIKSLGVSFSHVVFLQPTSPIRPPSCLDQALAQFSKEACNSLLSVEKLRDHFLWDQNSSGAFSLNHDFKKRKRRQDIPETYLENGSFYIFEVEMFYKAKNRLGGRIGLFPMDKINSIQIDNEDELKLCDAVLKRS